MKKNMRLIRSFGFEELKQAVAECADLEEAVKTGRMEDRIAVELVMIRYSG